jgi:hypothetical protein
MERAARMEGDAPEQIVRRPDRAMRIDARKQIPQFVDRAALIAHRQAPQA